MTRPRVTLILVVLLMAQGLVLYFFGQPTICTCGYVKLWEGAVLSSGNSQHLIDWYSFSHLIHGLLLYGALKLLFPRWSVGARLGMALGIEVGWEIIENTPWVINAYRQQALSQGYVGDSVINSLSDSLFMILGFLVAGRFPVWVSASVAIALEVFAGYMIRDNLVLNIINLFHPFEFIRRWQAGG